MAHAAGRSEQGPAIEGVPTSIAAFLGRTSRGPVNTATLVQSWSEFERAFGGLDSESSVSFAVRDFFRNGGSSAYVVRLFNDSTTTARLGISSASKTAVAHTGRSAPLNEENYAGDERRGIGIFALDAVDVFNLLCIPPDVIDGTLPPAVWAHALAYCGRRRAILIVDPPSKWTSPSDVVISDLGIDGEAARNAALYFPRLNEPDELRNGEAGTFVPCGAVAGAIARIDREHGVWRAPAGIDVQLEGVASLAVSMSDLDNAALNSRGVNCLRGFPEYGAVVWGVRTMRGSNEINDEFKYLPVRRLALFIEESIERGLAPFVARSSESLADEMREEIDVFMRDLFERGAFAGKKQEEAYSVRLAMAAEAIDVDVSFAPLDAGQFVTVRIRLQTGV